MSLRSSASITNEATTQSWLDLIPSLDDESKFWTCIEDIASSHRDGMKSKVFFKGPTGYNMFFALRFVDDVKWLIRFPIPGSCMYPDPKLQTEVAVMQFIKEKTAIPIPKVIASGVPKDPFHVLGPYILMECVDGIPLSYAILDFDDENQRLRKDIEASTLRHLYRQIAGIYLELFSHSFPAIGSLSMEKQGEQHVWQVDSTPITMKMNEMQRLGGVRFEVPGRPFDSAIHYLEDLATQSLTFLSEDDKTDQDPQEILEKSNSIKLLQSMSPHIAKKTDHLQYKLFCDDFRLANILVDKSFNIVAVLDWEFTYSAPASFLGSVPSWIVNTDPFQWNDEDERDFHAKADDFLAELEDEETSRGDGEHILSSMMRSSLHDGTFWHGWALRESTKLTEVLRRCINTEPFKAFQQADTCYPAKDKPKTTTTPCKNDDSAAQNADAVAENEPTDVTLGTDEGHSGETKTGSVSRVEASLTGDMSSLALVWPKVLDDLTVGVRGDK